MAPLMAILAGALALAVAVLAVIFVVVPIFKGVGFLIAHVFKFITGELGDLLRIVGAVVTSIIFIPLVLGTIVIGRWSASAHYGRAVQREFAAAGHSLYRVIIGRPAQFLGLGALTEGIEKRVPEALAHAPGADKPSKRTGRFEGYEIVGSLPGGGSGAKLYVADPSPEKLAAFARMGYPDVTQVIIKAFSLHDGSSLPQIVRESRALESAKKMGLVLEHELNDQRFFYIMPYVPGESLGIIAHDLHDASSPDGLTPANLRKAIGYVVDLAETLERYHRGGLWHKDVKPDNIIVHDNRAHLVDLGLVTPLRSAMTLTTHGTEYFRDPEMVRMALKGVKVHEVDGAKFDIYAVGAVLYSVIENSFPAHGGLSHVTKRCPEALRWIIRRAMADYRSRYETAADLATDLRAIVSADDPYAFLPKDLPSMGGREPEPMPADPVPGFPKTPAEPRPNYAEAAQAAAASAAMPVEPPARPRERVDRQRPRLRVTNWWTGGYVSERADQPPQSPRRPDGARVAHSPRPRPAVAAHRAAAGLPRKSAKDQLKSAQERVRAAQARVNKRLGKRQQFSSGPNPGVFAALFVFLAVCVTGAAAIVIKAMDEGRSVIVHDSDKGEESWMAYAESPEDDDQITFNVGGLDEFTLDLDELGSDAEEFVAQMKAAYENMRGSPSPAEEHLPAFVKNNASPLADPDFAPDDDVRILVLVDKLVEQADEEELDAMRRRLSYASNRGVTLLGQGDSEEELELIALARATIGNGVPRDPATVRRLQDWLTHDAGFLDGLVWIQLDKKGKRPEWHLFPNKAGQSESARRLMKRWSSEDR